MYLENCFFIDINGLVDIYLHNSINIFIPINYSYHSIFFFEDYSSYGGVLDQFYYNQKGNTT